MIRSIYSKAYKVISDEQQDGVWPSKWLLNKRYLASRLLMSCICMFAPLKMGRTFSKRR